jgi:transcriptional regulator with XRE-family HTH domain
MSQALHFPRSFRRIRTVRGLLQKTVALQLDVDPGALCAVEKGTRGPFDHKLLAKAAKLLLLTEDEQAELSWAAHHDRLVGLLSNRGASPMEVELISASLHALHHLRAEQRAGLLASVRRIGESAQLVANLSSNVTELEVEMT